MLLNLSLGFNGNENKIIIYQEYSKNKNQGKEISKRDYARKTTWYTSLIKLKFKYQERWKQIYK